MSKYKAMIAGVAILAVPALCSAQYSLVDNFESYTVGSYSGGSTAFFGSGGPWQSNTGGATGLVAIENDGNNYLAHGWNSGQRGAQRDVTSIAEGGVGTYYFQIRTEDASPDVSYGLSDVATGSAFSFGEFEVQIALTYSAATGIRLGARDGGSTVLDLATNLSANAWYDIWLVVDNSSDTFDVYYGQTGDANTLGTQIANDFGFRNGTAANDLVSVMTVSNYNEDNNANLDNIYYNPVAIPEPATLGLIGFCGIGIMFIRRRLMI